MSKSMIAAAALAVAAAGLGFTPLRAAAAGTVVYSAVESSLPANEPSQAFQAQQTNEFGDEVTFAGTDRLLQDVTITMSSWGCETGGSDTQNCSTTPGDTFSVPITLDLYTPPATEGDALTTPFFSITQAFQIPYRPSEDDTNCTGANAGKWYDASSSACYSGLATNITFDLSTDGVIVPDTVVWGLVYNTSQYGPSPNGCDLTPTNNCPIDSLNVALSPSVYTGSKPYPDTTYWNTDTLAYYCDGGAAGFAVFRLDSPTSACWGGYVPAAQFTAISASTPVPESPGAATLVIGGLGIVPAAAWIRRRTAAAKASRAAAARSR